MMIISMRVLEWTFCHDHLKRHPSFHANGDAPPRGGTYKYTPSLKQALRDACDLITNFRGINWNWSEGFPIPRETRVTNSTPRFLVSTAISAAVHFVLFDVSAYIVRSYAPTTIGCPDGGSIFDPSLSPFSRYARSSTITLWSGVLFYAAIQMIYDLNTINFIILFQQSPSEWPPLFNAPWAATSVSDFWGNRWHQLFRSPFIHIGSKPLSFLVGRTGGVMGAFLLSGIVHDWGMWAMGRGSNFQTAGGFFLLMGLGCVLENLFARVLGTKVQGWWGWLWTMVWVVGWGNLLVDTWGRTGLLGSTIMPSLTGSILGSPY